MATPLTLPFPDRAHPMSPAPSPTPTRIATSSSGRASAAAKATTAAAASQAFRIAVRASFTSAWTTIASITGATPRKTVMTAGKVPART